MIFYRQNLKFFLLSLLSIFLLDGSAQLIPFQHFGIEEGLIDENCYDVVQDKNGFVWLGTNSSLVRFDGSSFKTYPINGRTDIDVYRIKIQEDRLILIVENDEVYVMEGDSVFQPVSFQGLNRDSFNKRASIYKIARDDDNNIWLGFLVDSVQNFLFKKINRDNSVEKVNIPFGNDIASYVMSFSNQETTASSHLDRNYDKDSLLFILEKGDETTKINVPFEPGITGFLTDIKVYSKNTLAVSFAKKLMIIKNGKKLLIPLDEYAQTGGLFFDSHSTLWCATRFGSLTRVKILYSDEEELTYSISEYPNIIDATNFYQTSDNKLWIASGKEGLNYFSSKEVNLMKKLKVNDFTFFKNHLILGMKTGHLVDLKNNKRDTLHYFDKRIEKLYSTNEQIIVSGYPNNSKLIKDNLIQHIQYKGMQKMVETDSTFFLSSPNVSRRFDSLGNEKEYSFNEINNEQVQLGDNLFYHRTKGKIYKTKKGNDNSKELMIIAQNAFDLESTESGRVFYSDLEGSFFEIFRNDSVVKRLNRYPIFKERISQIVEDSNCLCIVFKNCIIRFNPEKPKEAPGYIFRVPGIYKGRFTKMEINNGLYYWSSAGGIYQSKDPFQSEDVAPLATYLELDGKGVIGVNEIVRDYENNSIVLNSKGFNYSKNPYIKQMVEVISESGRMLYELNGEDIFLPDLSAGEHKIVTFNFNSLTKHQSEITRLKILIQKPFWMRTWFWILCFIAFVLPVTYFVFQKNRSKLEKEKLSNQLRRIRSKAIASQLNPHFIFNALGSIQFLVNEERSEEANDYLSQFAKLLRQVLEHTEKDWYSFNKERQTLELYLSLENLRFKKDTEINIYNRSGLNETSFCIPPLFLQLLVENSVIHGLRNVDYKGKVAIEVEQNNSSEIQIIVLDNGVGFPKERITKSDSKKSLGLSIIKERLRLISKTEKIVCQLDYGTYKEESEYNSYVKINLPIKQC